MAKIYTHSNERIAEYLLVFHAILKKEHAAETIRRKKEVIALLQPADIIELVECLLCENLRMADLKYGLIKFLSLVSKQLANSPYQAPRKDSYLDCLLQNNQYMENHLFAIRGLLKGFGENPYDDYCRKELRVVFRDLEAYTSYYAIKEKVLFPLLEQAWPDSKCLQVMQSFHKDVRKSLKDIQLILAFPDVDIKLFHITLGIVFFKMLGLKMRDERILFPAIQASLDEHTLNSLFAQSMEIGFPYYTPERV